MASWAIISDEIEVFGLVIAYICDSAAGKKPSKTQFSFNFESSRHFDYLALTFTVRANFGPSGAFCLRFPACSPGGSLVVASAAVD